MSKLSRFEDQPHYRYAALLAVLVGVGLWLRIRNLGHLSLIVDEGVEAQAVQSILQHGTPVMDSGLIYLRFPLYLYMQAGLAYLFELNEFWLRLPSVIFGVAAIVPTYILGKDLFNRPIGALSATIFALSVWEIEMSRYGRPYIALQFFFLVALICFYRGFMLDERRFKVWFLVASFFAFLTHELSQVIAPLFLIPLVSPSFTWKRKLQFGYWAVGFAAIMMVSQKLNGIHRPEGISSPTVESGAAVGVIEQVTNALGVPSINGPDMSHFLRVVQEDVGLTAALVLIAGLATSYLFYRLFRTGKGVRFFLGLLMIWAAFAYQFGLTLIFFVVYLAAFARDRQIVRDRILLAALGAAFVFFAGWFVILARSPQLLVVEVPLVLFEFPAFYKYLLRWLVKGWPVITAGLVIGSTWLFVRFLRDRRDTAALFLLGALYIPALFASLFESAFVPVYTLHLYPLIVLIFGVAVWNAGALAWRYVNLGDTFSGHYAFLLAIPVVLFASQDTNPLSAWRVSERTYQSEKPPIRNVTTFQVYSGFHQDIKGVGLFVRKHMDEEDAVAVIGPGYTIPLYQYYIGDVDYFIASERKIREFSIYKNKKPVHYITGDEFIHGPEKLERLISNRKKDIWVIGDYGILRKSNPYYKNEKVKEIIRNMSEKSDYIGRDSITFAEEIH